jgi:hypothetical protein
MALRDRGSAYTLQEQHTDHWLLSAAAALTAGVHSQFSTTSRGRLPPVDGPAGPWQRIHPACTAHITRSVASSRGQYSWRLSCSFHYDLLFDGLRKPGSAGTLRMRQRALHKSGHAATPGTVEIFTSRVTRPAAVHVRKPKESDITEVGAHLSPSYATQQLSMSNPISTSAGQLYSRSTTCN